MAYEYIEPAVSQQEEAEAKAVMAGPKSVVQTGTYNVTLRTMSGKDYEKDGESRELASLFFGIDGSNNYGAELALFRVGGDRATTTSLSAVTTIGRVAGLDSTETSKLNWAIDRDSEVNKRGMHNAAFIMSNGEPLSVEGLKFEADIELVEDAKGFKKNVVKKLRATK